MIKQVKRRERADAGKRKTIIDYTAYGIFLRKPRRRGDGGATKREKESNMKIELPCEIGDAAYYIDSIKRKVVKSTVKAISVNITKTGIIARVLFDGEITSKTFGRNAFLTRTETNKSLTKYKAKWQRSERLDKE